MGTPYFPPPPLKVTSCPPHMHILTSCTYSHLTCSPPPPLLKVTLRPPRIHILTSHTYSHLACSPPPKIICFTSHGKNSQKSHAATPIPLIRYLLRATNKLLGRGNIKRPILDPAFSQSEEGRKCPHCNHYFSKDISVLKYSR